MLFKEKYQKANDEIPVNGELFALLLKKADQYDSRKKQIVSWVGTAAVAAAVGICMFLYADTGEKPVQRNNTMANAEQTETEKVEKTEFQTETVSHSAQAEAGNETIIINKKAYEAAPKPESSVSFSAEILADKERQEIETAIPATASIAQTRIADSYETEPCMTLSEKDPDVVGEMESNLSVASDSSEMPEEQGAEFPENTEKQETVDEDTDLTEEPIDEAEYEKE